jgi:hypothetical protein
MRKNHHPAVGIPGSAAKRIMRRCAMNEPFVVVPRNGAPSRCFALEKYQKMREHPLGHKPWEHRKKRASAAPDPLGAIKGKVRSPLRRADIYE